MLVCSADFGSKCTVLRSVHIVVHERWAGCVCVRAFVRARACMCVFVCERPAVDSYTSQGASWGLAIYGIIYYDKQGIVEPWYYVVHHLVGYWVWLVNVCYRYLIRIKNAYPQGCYHGNRGMKTSYTVYRWIPLACSRIASCAAGTCSSCNDTETDPQCWAVFGVCHIGTHVYT